ncbi:MAG: hypothetical protein ACTSUE_03730 [Promethearchaeota archaeon]
MPNEVIIAMVNIASIYPLALAVQNGNWSSFVLIVLTGFSVSKILSKQDEYNAICATPSEYDLYVKVQRRVLPLWHAGVLSVTGIYYFRLFM